MYNYSTDYYTYYNTSALESAEAATGILSVIAGLGTFFWLVSMAVAVLSIISMWKVFKKAGKPGWASLIPVYNTVVLFQISGLNPWLLLLFLVPIVDFIAIPVLMILQCVKLAKAFGKSGGFAVGLIFLNVIFMPILAFSDAEYEGVQ